MRPVTLCARSARDGRVARDDAPFRPCGFTLIELLVAVTILAVVAALGWRGLSEVADSRDAARTAFDTSSRLADGLQQLGDDLRQAVDAGTGLPAVQVIGDALWIVRRPPQPLGGDLRADSIPPVNGGALEVVRWVVTNGALTRAVSAPSSSRQTLLAAISNPTPEALTILPGVSDMRIAFFRYAGIGLLQQSGAWVNPGTAANTETTNAATAANSGTSALQNAASATTPAAVKVQLDLDGGSLRGRLMRDFLLEDRE